MSIIPSLPNTLLNGQTADATQVMANFNTIVSAVNSSAAQAGANSDITSLSGLTTPLSVAQGGTGATTLAGASLVTGPASATSGDVPSFSGASGKVLADGYSVGTAASNLVQLNGSGGLPAVSPTSPLDVLGSAQGDIVQRGASAWQALAPGTAGQVLSSGGAAANNSWATPPFTKSFVSADQVIALAGPLTIPHSLGARPTLVQIYYVCVIAEFGYVANDIVLTTPQMFAISTDAAMSVIVDATNIVVRFGASDPRIVNATSGVNSAITPSAAKWKVRFLAWV